MRRLIYVSLALVTASLALKTILVYIPYCRIEGVVDAIISVLRSKIEVLGVIVYDSWDKRENLIQLLTILLATGFLVELVLLYRGVKGRSLLEAVVNALSLDVIQNMFFLLPIIQHLNLDICNNLASIAGSRITSLGLLVLGEVHVDRVYEVEVMLAAMLSIVVAELIVIFTTVRRLTD